MLTHERLIWHLNYNKKTGKFTRLVDSAIKQAGEKAGCVSDGAPRVGLMGRLYKECDLAWMYCYGEMPKGKIIHLDGDRTNNRISNLVDLNTRTTGDIIRVVKSVIRKNMGSVAVDKETGKWCVSDFIGVVKSGFETSDEAYDFAVEHFKLIRK